MGDYREQLEAIEQVERYLPGSLAAQFLRHTCTHERGLTLARLGRLEEGKQLLEALLPQVSSAGDHARESIP